MYLTLIPLYYHDVVPVEKYLFAFISADVISQYLNLSAQTPIIITTSKQVGFIC